LTLQRFKGRVLMDLNRIVAALLLVLAAVFSLPGLSVVAFAEDAGAKDGGPAAQRAPVTVTSDTMEAVTGERKVVFRGHVQATTDFTLCSDSLEIIYGKDKDVERIEASGNVRVFKDDKQSTSEHLVYDRVGRVLVLTGKPKITQCNDMIGGDKITIYLDRDDALVESEGGGRVRAVIMPEKGCAGTGTGKGVQGENAPCEGSR